MSVSVSTSCNTLCSSGSSSTGSGPSGVDMELKKAFQELQIKMLDTNQKIKMADAQIDALKKAIQHARLTHAEVFTLPEDTPLYKQIGRLFVEAAPDEINTMLRTKIKDADKKIEDLETSKVYLEKSLKESEKNLRELVAHKQKDR